MLQNESFKPIDMAYRINIHGTLGNNVREIVGEQIEKSLKVLSAKPNHASSIHETRKSMKRIRAIIKLVRPALSKSLYRQENQRFRAIANQLSHARDSDVLIETLLKLESTSDSGAQSSIVALRRYVETITTKNEAVKASAVASAREALGEAAKNYEHFEPVTDSLSIIKAGLRVCYRQARRARRTAYESNIDEAFHEWRKPVQLHWRHMSLLSNAWPDMFKARIELARTLSQLLGDDHDLSVLMEFSGAAAKSGAITRGTAATVKKISRARQQVLRDTARPLGEMLFQQPAKAHAEYIYGILNAARDLNHPTAGSHLTVDKSRKDHASAPATSNAS